MKTFITIEARAFPVTIRDNRTDAVLQDTITLSKEQLRACQTVGQSSKELIWRIYNREGYTVLDIGAAERRTIRVNLEELWRLHSRTEG